MLMLVRGACVSLCAIGFCCTSGEIKWNDLNQNGPGRLSPFSYCCCYIPLIHVEHLLLMQRSHPPTRQSESSSQYSLQAAPHLPKKHEPQFMGETLQSAFTVHVSPHDAPPLVLAQYCVALHTWQFESRQSVSREHCMPHPAPHKPSSLTHSGQSVVQSALVEHSERQPAPPATHNPLWHALQFLEHCSCSLHGEPHAATHTPPSHDLQSLPAPCSQSLLMVQFCPHM